jgi:hypothetical protein
MFNLITLLPHFMTMGDNIIKCIDGGVTQEEWDKTVDDFFKMCKDIPQVQGVIAIIEIVSMVTKVSFPLVDNLLNNDDASENKPKLKSVRKKIADTVTDDERMKAVRSIKFFDDVMAKIAEANGLINDDRDTSWTETFFDDMPGVP